MTIQASMLPVTMNITFNSQQCVPGKCGILTRETIGESQKLI